MNKLKILFASSFVAAVFTSTASAGDAYQLQTNVYNDVLSDRVVHAFQNQTTQLEVQQIQHRFFGEGSIQQLTKLHYAKSFGNRRWSMNVSNSEDEHNAILGLGWKNVTFSFMDGKSESFLRDAGSFAGVYRFGLHGGNNIGFRYTGAGIDIGLTDKLHAQTGFAKLTSDHSELETRAAQYLQLSYGNTYGRFSLLDRGEQQIGHVVEAGLNFKTTDFLIQQMSLDGDKKLTRFRTKRALNHATDIMFDLANVNDPLHYDQSRYTALFSISHRLHSSPKYYYSLKNEDSAAQADKQRKSRNQLALIGLGVVAAAAIGSSGSDSGDSSARLVSERDAAFNILNAINPTSVRENREYGGWIYRNQDNSYSSTQPVRGTNDSVLLPNPFTTLPTGTTLTASYHTHAGFDPRYDNENFSPTDINSDNSLGIGGYLGTPAGAFKYHFGGNVTVLGTIAN